MSLRGRLMSAFGVLALLIAIVALLGWRALSANQERFAAYVAEDARRAVLAGALLDAANGRALAARNIALLRTAPSATANRSCWTAMSARCPPPWPA
jgi:methyl-accepting chemotaxis protein-1 (serine sensor receptor)